LAENVLTYETWRSPVVKISIEENLSLNPLKMGNDLLTPRQTGIYLRKEHEISHARPSDICEKETPLGSEQQGDDH
jgi:hypothetical protein